MKDLKFSIIVPVYNTENYVSNCLKSIINQTYKNFELIIINDGTTDNSEEMIIPFLKDKRIKYLKHKNRGLSYSRNRGISLATGDYFICVDSDDDINENLLYELISTINTNSDVDMIKFNINKISNNSNSTIEKNALFCNLDGEKAFSSLMSNSLFMTAWSYAYRTAFWKKNKFKYFDNRLHEDYGIIPYVVLKAKNVCSIDYIGYNYYVRENSITQTVSKKNLIQKNIDVLFQFDKMIKKTESDKTISKKGKKLYMSYMSYALINRCSLFKDNMKKEYVNELKRRKLYKYLIDDTIPRKIKKIIYKFNPNLFVKIFVR